jgi:peptidoglycan/LPS O-acetylase OafA/YrhL
MSATMDLRPPAAPAGDRGAPPRGVDRVRAAVAAVGATLLGAAPHVLHHAGPLAGAALLGGVSGRLLFAAIGFVAAVPMLRRLQRRTGSWRMPAAVLGAMVALFTFSTLVIGPALTGGGGDSSPVKPARPGVTQPLPAGHGSHHP